MAFADSKEVACDLGPPNLAVVYFGLVSGCSSLVERYVRDVEVGGSIPLTPTIFAGPVFQGKSPALWQWQEAGWGSPRAPRLYVSSTPDAIEDDSWQDEALEKTCSWR